MQMEYRGAHVQYSRRTIFEYVLLGLFLLLIVEIALLFLGKGADHQKYVLGAFIGTAVLVAALLAGRGIWGNDTRDRVLLHDDALEHDRQRIPYSALESASLSLILGRTVRANRDYEDVVTTHVFLCCTVRAAGYRDVQIGERLGTFGANLESKVEELRAMYPFPCQDEGYHLPWMLELGALEFREFLYELGQRAGVEVPAVPAGEWSE